MQTTTSQTRREAISRATEFVVMLAAEPEATDAAHRLAATVNDHRSTDTQAWEAVNVLEEMVHRRGLITEQQWRARAERRRPEVEAALAADLARWGSGPRPSTGY